MKDEKNYSVFDQMFWDDTYASDPIQSAAGEFFLEEEIDNLPVGTALEMNQLEAFLGRLSVDMAVDPALLTSPLDTS